MLHIYTDGSTKGNGKKHSKGGYSIVIFDDNHQHLIDAYYEQQNNTTNNRMELSALLKTFELLNTKYKGMPATIYSDSSYVINILTSWIYIWSQNNWIGSNKGTIKNLDLVQSLYKYYNIDFFICQIDFVKVKGHCGILGNQLADALSQADVSKFSNIILKNHINLKLEEKTC